MENTMQTVRKMIQLDVDALHAYELALPKIDNAEVQSRIAVFRDDHQRHIDDLCDFLRKHDERIPELKLDAKGYLIEGMTALRSAMGTEGALKAMRSNEKTTNKQYREALEQVEVGEAREILNKNYQDEKRHLAYIEQVLDSESWRERKPA